MGGTSHLWCPKGCGKTLVYTSDVIHKDQDSNVSTRRNGKLYVCKKCGFTTNKKLR